MTRAMLNRNTLWAIMVDFNKQQNFQEQNEHAHDHIGFWY
jgi:hypothetical protein